MNKTVIKFQDRNYEIPFPNVGQFMEIEEKKLQMTNGRYSMLSLNAATMKSQAVLLDIVDTVATFTTLSPDIKNALGGDSFNVNELEIGSSLAELVGQYNEVYLPFQDEYVERNNAKKMFRVMPIKQKEENGGNGGRGKA